MSERLFIRLGQTIDDKCSWLVWSEQEQEIISSGELASATELSSLTSRAESHAVEVLVPCSAVGLSQIEMPEKGYQQALKALPFMMEESLAQDVEDLHFVTGAREGGKVAVAIVAKEQVELWLDWLRQAGIKTKKMVPDCLALPLENHDWACLELNDELIIRTGDANGLALPVAWQNVGFNKLVAESDQNEFTIATYSEVTIANDQVTPHPQTLELPMLVLAKGLSSTKFNLLSGEYAPKRELGKHLKIWKNSAIIFTILLTFTLINQFLTIKQYNTDAKRLQLQSEQIYKQAIPGSSRIVNIRNQMDSHLRGLQGEGGGVAFFTMLDGMTETFNNIKTVRPTTIRFDGARDEIRMQVTGSNFDDIEKFKNAISKNYNVDSGAMNSNETTVTSTLTIRGK